MGELCNTSNNKEENKSKGTIEQQQIKNIWVEDTKKTFLQRWTTDI